MMQKNNSPLKALVYHNEKCSKSNAALNLLLEYGLQVDTVNYLDTPLSNDQLRILLKQLDIEAVKLIRFGEPVAKALGLGEQDNRDNEEWISLLLANPVLMERPVIVVKDKAVIGRPIESVLDLIKTNQ